MNINSYMKKVGEQAKASSYLLAKSSTEQKNNFLHDLSKRIIANEQKIIDANKHDLEDAKKNNLDEAFIDRLALNKKNIATMAEGLRQVQSLNDLIGEITDSQCFYYKSNIEWSEPFISQIFIIFIVTHF